MNLLIAIFLSSATLPVLDTKMDAIGSASLLGPQLALTAAHVITKTDNVVACMNGYIRAKLSKFDVKSDLATLVLERPCSGVDISPLAAKDADAGVSVTIQGYPNGARRTNAALVADYAELSGSAATRTYMLFDGKVEGGNSGGPVLNRQGELVGMVQGKICYNRGDSVCYGAAIPLKTIRKFFLESQ